MKNIRVNLSDQFSGCTDSKELTVSNERLAKFEHIQMNGIIIQENSNGIAYEWIIEEIELLN